MLRRAALASLLTALSASAQPTPLAPLARAIQGAIHVDDALATVNGVQSSDRWFTFPRFAATRGYLAQRLTAAGATAIEPGAAPADGRTRSGWWTQPLAWDAESATLAVTAPEAIPLCDYRQTPSCLGMWSGPTPPGGLDAELVNLDTTPLAQVRGKLVLTSRNSAGLKGKLAAHGALGAVNGFSENPELPDDRQWINAWGDQGWGFLAQSTPLLSYSVTPRQARRLEELLARGPVRVHAEARTRTYAGEYPWLTALLPGADQTNPEEVLVLAHTAEQGANDNATGVSAAIEALATLHRLIDSGQLPRPRRSIRILLMPEMYGSLHYLTTHPERSARTVAAFTVDSPAASYDLAGTEYTLHRNPHVALSWADALVPRLARAVLPRRRPFHTADHTTGTDAYLGDPLIGIPDVWIYSGTGVTTHHNSADLPATVDRRSLGDLTAIVAGYLYYAAAAGESELPWLTGITLDAALDDLRAAAAQALDAHAAGDPALASFAAGRLDYLTARHAAALAAIARLLPPGRRAAAQPALDQAIAQTNAFAAAQQTRLRQAGIAAYTPPALPEARALVVRRLRPGTIPLDELPVEQWEGFPSGAWDKLVTVALYWCDGRRNLEEVARLTAMEMNRPLSFHFVNYFRFLERHGYVEFVR